MQNAVKVDLSVFSFDGIRASGRRDETNGRRFTLAFVFFTGVKGSGFLWGTVTHRTEGGRRQTMS